MEATQIVMATFPSESGADQAVEQLKQMARDGSIEIIEAAVIRRAADGETSVDQVNLPSAKRWAGKGALIGGLVGLIFPPTIIGSALVGAGIGAGTGAFAKHALANDELMEAAAELEPDTSSFMAVIDQKWAKELAVAMKGYAKLAEHTLDADTAANLEMITDEASGVAAFSGTVMAQDEDAAVVSSLEVVEDLKTGVTAASGGTVHVDEESVVLEEFQAVAVADEVPDAVGGYEATQALAEGEEE
jgi:uncharacterized membrane protein